MVFPGFLRFYFYVFVWSWLYLSFLSFFLCFFFGLLLLDFLLKSLVFLDYWFWREFFVCFPSNFFLPALMCFSTLHIILLQPDCPFSLLQTRVSFLYLDEGGSLSSFSHELGGDDGSLDDLETLHKFSLQAVDSSVIAHN